MTPGSMSPGPGAHDEPLERGQPHATSRPARPPSIADAEAPLPRWNTICFSSRAVAAEELGRRAPTRTCATCRGSRTAGCGAASRPAASIAYVYAAGGQGRGRTRCRTPRRAGRRGTPSRAASIPVRFAGLCSGASTESSSMLISTTRRDDRRLEEPLAAVHHAMPDRDDRRPPSSGRPVSANASSITASPPCGRRSARWRSRQTPVRGGGRRCAPLGLADALDEPGRRGRTGVHVDQLVLERRRTAVDDQDDAHATLRLAPCAWIAVMAMVLTMSSTSAPRDRSLIGLLRPCSTGPIGDRAGAALHRLVGVVAGVEVGEDEHRRPPGHRRVRASSRPRPRLGGGVVLDGPLDQQLRAHARARARSRRAPSRPRRREPDSPVEYDSIAMRGSMPNCAAVAADEIAMSASCSAVGSGITAQSP